ARHRRRTGSANGVPGLAVEIEDARAWGSSIHKAPAVRVRSKLTSIDRRHGKDAKVGVGGWVERSSHRLVAGRRENSNFLLNRFLNDFAEKWAIPFAAEAEVQDGSTTVHGRTNPAGNIKGARGLVRSINIHR